MLDFQKCAAQDRVAAAIERKRQLEEARRARIFNPRVRIIGVDKDYLDKQVEEKKRLRDTEREQECRMDEELVRSSQLATLLQRQQDEERRKLNKAINDFRQTYQRPEYCRDFDLNDPEQLKKSKPAIDAHEDLGPSSAQKFEGEDENQAERHREQREQMNAWIVQQVDERRRAERERAEAERKYQEALLGRDGWAMRLDKIERECRRKLNEATAKFNRALAREQEQRKCWLAAQEEEDSRAEIYNHVTGDFLNESRDQANSACGPRKPIVSRYKGMNSDDLKAIRDEQARQMEEIRRLKASESAKNDEWNQLMNGNAKAAESYQRELDQQRSELNKQIAEENQRLAQEQRLHQEYLNRHVYKHKPSSEFFAQFNKNTR